jgi:pyridoxamine 5'-phosphate oxidase
MLSTPPFADTLILTLEAAFGFLKDAVESRRSPMHTPSVATIGLDGQPRTRIVVLRGFDGSARTVRFHTDQRSEKFLELSADPRLSMLFYDPAVKAQIRLEGQVKLHRDDGIAEDAWQASQAMSRHCYATEPASGSVIETGGAFIVPKGRELSDDGKPNFVAVVLHFNRLEWLWLGADGHRRALFDWLKDDREPRMRWLAP